MLTVVCQGLIRHCGASQYVLSMARDIHWVTIVVIIVIVVIVIVVIVIVVIVIIIVIAIIIVIIAIIVIVMIIIIVIILIVVIIIINNMMNWSDRSTHAPAQKSRSETPTYHMPTPTTS